MLINITKEITVRLVGTRFPTQYFAFRNESLADSHQRSLICFAINAGEEC